MTLVSAGECLINLGRWLAGQAEVLQARFGVLGERLERALRHEPPLVQLPVLLGFGVLALGVLLGAAVLAGALALAGHGLLALASLREGRGAECRGS